MHLPTNAVILRWRVTPIPITPSIITQVHHIAERDGMPKGLKVHNCFGTLLYDSAWIAGVDYNEEQFDDDNYDEQYDEHGNPIEQDEAENEQDEELEEELYNEIDQNEIDDIANNDNENYEIIQDEEADEANPTNVDEDEEYNENENENEIMVDEVPVDANPTNVVEDEENENEIMVDEDEEPVDAEAEQVNNVEIEEEVEETTTRSGRVSRAPTQMNMFQENMKNLEYTDQEARVLAYTMTHIHGKCPTEFQFIQTYTLQQGIK